MPNNNPQQTTPQQQIARAAESTTRAAERLESSAESAASMAIDKVRQVREEAQSGIEQQRDEIAHRIRRVSDALRLSGQSLSTDDPLSQQLFDNVGDRIERIAEYVANVTPGELAGDVQSLARRRPGLFFGGSFILGLALGRFAKSSAGAATAGAGGQFHDEYEDTIAVRPAASRSQKSSRSQKAGVAGTRTTRPTTTTASAPTTLPQGVGSSASSSATATSTGTGANTAPAYGGSSSTPAARAQPTNEAASTGAKAQSASEATGASNKPHSVAPGEGSKS